MNPLKALFRPVDHLVDAVVMPFKALFVVGLCGLINAMTWQGTWWVKWVALGMGIAVVVAWARAAKTLLTLAVIAVVGWWVWRRWGDDARAAFDAWVARSRPQAAQVVEVLRRGPSAAA